MGVFSRTEKKETKECEEVGCSGEECKDSDSPGDLAQQFYEWQFSWLASPSIALSCRKRASPEWKQTWLVSMRFIFCQSLTAGTTAPADFVWLFPSSSLTCDHFGCISAPPVLDLHRRLWEFIAKMKAFSNLFVWKRSEKTLSGLMQHPCNALSCFLIAYPLTTAKHLYFLKFPGLQSRSLQQIITRKT